MTIDDVRQWVTLIVALIALGGTVYGWFASPAKAAGDAARKVGERVDGLDARLVRLEGHVEHLPTAVAVHRLELLLTEIRGEMRALEERMEMVSKTSARLQEWLLAQGK